MTPRTGDTDRRLSPLHREGQADGMLAGKKCRNFSIKVIKDAGADVVTTQNG